MRYFIITLCLIMASSAGMQSAMAAGKTCDPRNNAAKQKKLQDCLYRNARKYHRQQGSPLELGIIIYDFCYKERKVMHEAIKKDCGYWQARRILPGFDKVNIKSAAGYIVRQRGR